MKRSLLAILMLLLVCSFAFGQVAPFDDYVMIDQAQGNNAWDPGEFSPGFSADLGFFVTHQCPNPGNVTGLSLPFAFSAVGAASWTYTGETLNHNTDWFSFGVTINSGSMPTAYLLGGASIGLGIPLPTIDELFFTIHFDMGAGEGQMCVDSAFFPPAGAWKFSNTTCDPVGGPRPYFVDATGSDANHPICIDVYAPECTPPTINVTPVGDQLTGSHCNGLGFTFGADPGALGADPATPITWAVISGPGGFSGAAYSVAAQPTGTYPVEIEVTNDCGLTDTYMFDLVFTNLNPSITNCPAAQIQVGQGNPVVVNLDATDPNSCDGLTWSVVANQAVVNAPSIDGTGLFQWQTEFGEGGSVYSFTATVDDGEGGTADCIIEVNVLTSEPFEIQIEKVENQYQGHYANVSIFLNAGSEAFGGFDFLVAYDASALTFMGATLGAQLDGCWEYFTYRFGWEGNCSGSCPSGLLRVVGIADVNNGPYHPDPACLRKQIPFPGQDELVNLTFYVTNDRTFECMYIPIRFFWHDCGDNAISNIYGDTLWIDRDVYDYDWSLGYRLLEPGLIHYGGHEWIGDCANDNPEKPSPIEFIDFINGGIDIACADSIDLRGDLNLNNVANEIADAVLYTNYFIYGIGVFNINVEGQIAASDVNNDGRVLTVGDLVYLVRIVTGDALPYPKLSPFANNVTIEQGSVVKSTSQANIGAALFVFDGEGEATLLANGMKMTQDVVNGQLRVLVWSDGTNYVPAGNQNLISVTGDLSIVNTEVADYYGNLMTSTVVEKTLPTAFSLSQNYPNPFNPTTDITINLPTQQSWKLDIYNVAGQLVKSFSGNNVGEVTVTWDAAGAASGIYFYKATAGQYTDTKKMVLMK